MTNPTWIEETTLPDTEGNPTTVRKGDKVNLADVGSIVDEEKKYFANRHADFLRRWLGDGPYAISNMGRWPCGRVMIYVKTKISSGSGVHASDLIYYERSSRANEVSVR